MCQHHSRRNVGDSYTMELRGVVWCRDKVSRLIADANYNSARTRRCSDVASGGGGPWTLNLINKLGWWGAEYSESQDALVLRWFPQNSPNLG